MPRESVLATVARIVEVFILNERLTWWLSLVLVAMGFWAVSGKRGKSVGVRAGHTFYVFSKTPAFSLDHSATEAELLWNAFSYSQVRSPLEER